MNIPPDAPTGRALVTGASGYIGGRLVPELLAAGFHVRVLTRRAEQLRDRPWFADVDIVVGDASDEDVLARSLANIEVAYYLLHSLVTGDGFERVEQEMADAFGTAAEAAHVGRIIYLGGLVPTGEHLSPHLKSRMKVGEILRASGVPAIELRAAVIIGSGSASFEMLRYLTERLPAMVTPRWVHNRIQPIAIRDVLRYLVAAARLPQTLNRTFDIGGPDVLTYAEMMQRYAAVAGLSRRVILPVPVLSPTLSSHWVGLITPVPSSIARPLVESLRHEVFCREHDIESYVPSPTGGLIGIDRAVELALRRIKDADVATRWSNASVRGAPSDPLPTDPDWAGGSLYVDERERPSTASPRAIWQIIEGIGGDRGWYSFPLAWELRGVLDRLAGGVGLRRGRRDRNRLMVGESLDFWRVEEREPGHLLRLRAEMRLPGLAWLEMRVESHPTVYHQRAIFHPRGLLGHMYWWVVAPFHGIVFGSMVRNITRAAEDLDSGGHADDDADTDGDENLEARETQAVAERC
ncbi:MAG TPA: SDR family oxidoreductase [Actinomycetes bacterium]|nr:SDR family oxidoreductase [Actinomycetes bacterium]